MSENETIILGIDPGTSIFGSQTGNRDGGDITSLINPDDVGLPAFGLCQWRGQRWENLILFSYGTLYAYYKEVCEKLKQIG